MGDLHPVTIAIIAVNVLFSMKGFNDYDFKSKYLFNVGAIRRGEQVRMISSAFLHANTQHLFFNMLSLYFFAYAVIYKLGVVNFVLIYMGSLLLGNLLSYFFHKDEYHYSALGASGAVSGVIYAAIIVDPGLEIWFLPGFVFGIGYLFYSIYGMRAQNDNIGHDAHFGGAIGGYIMAVAMMPSVLQTNMITVIGLAIPIIILFIMIKLGKI